MRPSLERTATSRPTATTLEAAERRVAGEIDPGARALVVAILVFVLLVSFCCRTPAMCAAWTS